MYNKVIESFSYEWETYGTELRSRYGIENDSITLLYISV